MTSTPPRSISLVRQLNAEWAAIAGRVIDCGTREGCTGAEWLAAVRQSTGLQKDEVLHRLLVVGRDGNAAAERIVLQALIPAAQRMAQRVRGLDDLDRIERADYAIGAAWESIRTYRLHLREHVMANLTMNTLRLLTPQPTANERIIAAHTITVADEVLESVPSDTRDPAPEVELANVLAWAVDSGVLTASEVTLLIQATLGDDTHAVIADELGLSVEGLRSRLTRIRKRLTTAAQIRYLAA